MKQKYTTIKGLSQTRRLPRLGKIRLGIKKISVKTNKEYPTEVEYLVVPPEVAVIYGDRPTELDIMFPVNDPEIFFPQSYKMYGSNQKLKCQGDGEAASRWTEEGFEEISCPCDQLEKRQCSQRGNLMILLQKVSFGGVYQLDTGSINNIIAINSYIEYLQALIGRVAMIPLKLKRIPRKVEYEGKMSTHYLLQLEFAGGEEIINQLRQDTNRIIADTSRLAIEPPKIEGAEADTPIEIIEEEITPISVTPDDANWNTKLKRLIQTFVKQQKVPEPKIDACCNTLEYLTFSPMESKGITSMDSVPETFAELAFLKLNAEMEGNLTYGDVEKQLKFLKEVENV